MQGGQTRDFVLLRTAIAIACAALIAMIAAPAALAGAPATDQYGSALPGGGNGGNTGGSSPSGGSGTTIPVAPNSSSSSQAKGGSSAAGGTKAAGAHGGAKGGASHNGHKPAQDKAGAGQPPVDTANANHSVPQIAADSAGDSWLPFFIGGMVALACAGAALVFLRNRRRAAQG